MVLTFQGMNEILRFQLPELLHKPGISTDMPQQSSRLAQPKTQETHAFSFANSQESACLESLQLFYHLKWTTSYYSELPHTGILKSTTKGGYGQCLEQKPERLTHDADASGYRVIYV